jgi:hypothetical protein
VYVFAVIGFVLVAVYAAVEFGFTNTRGIIDNQHDYFKNQVSDASWRNSDEWLTLKAAIVKDISIINKVSLETGVSARIIVAPLVVEQLRLFHSDRELFKQVFAPLQILGNQSQFSWGVMGIKQETARRIESNLKDTSSPWHLGKDFEHMLDYSATTSPADIDDQRFLRLTDEHDRYYSYLYGALYIKELEAQWQMAGLPISNRPDIIATLYNIGFDNSRPHANPLSGGAEIDINGTVYSFGSLAQSFYDSGELTEEFGK